MAQQFKVKFFKSGSFAEDILPKRQYETMVLMHEMIDMGKKITIESIMAYMGTTYRGTITSTLNALSNKGLIILKDASVIYLEDFVGVENA